MQRKRHKAEEIAAKLRQVEVLTGWGVDAYLAPGKQQRVRDPMPLCRRRGRTPTRKALPNNFQLLIEAKAPPPISLDNLKSPNLMTIK
jgi:hypothetical protein